MSYRRIHLLEKFQVQLATVAAVVFVYFAIWPLLRPWDPQGPVAFVPNGNFGGAALLAGVMVLLAGGCSLVTLSSRPEGALLAALLGAGGISLRLSAASVRSFLWWHDGALSGLYGQFLLEVLMLMAAVFIAALVVDVVRGLVGIFKPRWMWKDLTARLSQQQGDQDRRKSGSAARGDHPPAATSLLIDLIPPLAAYFTRRSAGPKGGKAPAAGRKGRGRSALCLLLGLFISVLMLALLLQSTDRGQILFALLISFMLAALIAHQVFPAPHSIVAWIMPAIIAVACYALTANTVSATAQTWMDVPDYGHVLPIDWLTAGTGGAVLGYWISARIHDARHFEHATQQ